MNEKPIITGDFQDEKTGIRFLEDRDGRLHCMSCMFQPMEGSGEITNNYNTTNNYTLEDDIYKNSTPIILCTSVRDFTWATTSDFNRVNNTFTGGFFGYTTPVDKEFHITNILASAGKDDITKNNYLGIFKAGVFQFSLPVSGDLNFRFFRPLKIPHSTYTEIKFRPYNKKLELGLTWIGYLI